MKSSVSRRSFLQCGALTAAAATPLVGALASSVHGAEEDSKPIDQAGLTFLKEMAAATIESARVKPGESRGGMGPNTTGIALVTPGGNYPALWTRDFAMSLDCGLIGVDEMLSHLRLIAKCQNGEKERTLPSGAIIPPFAIVDHVNFAGGAVFYPGTFSSGDDQGAVPWGPLPPLDDHYYFIHIAYAIWLNTHDTRFLDEKIDGISLFDRLVKAFHSPASDPKTGAAVTSKERRGVGFGFQDSVYLQGSMSFATLLRYQAARELVDLCLANRKNETDLERLQRATQIEERAKTGLELLRSAVQIVDHFLSVFTDPKQQHGWLLAATEVGRQPDVWATLFLLHLGILPEFAKKARETVAAAVRAPGHTIEYQGAVRHVPSDRYFKPDQCWESSVSAVNTYQSGAFWHTPTGWLIEALQPVDPALARQVCDRFLNHLREQDFRKGKDAGAPWECFGIDMAAAQNPVYMTSVTLPLAVLMKMQ